LAADLSFAVPGDLTTLTGGYVYDRRLAAELIRTGWSIDVLAWAPSFPHPSAADEDSAAASLAALPDSSLVLIDGLAFGALPELAEAKGRRLRLVALVHHPLALEPELSPEERDRLKQSERRALAAAMGVIATSETTAGMLIQDYGVAPDRLAVAKPGTDPAPFARGSGPGARGPHILSVGTRHQPCAIPSRPTGSASASGFWVKPPISARSTTAPISSCSRAAMKAMAWSSPRRFSAACR
jgi:hypothetical protein